jgi:hypothetical protein
MLMRSISAASALPTAQETAFERMAQASSSRRAGVRVGIQDHRRRIDPSKQRSPSGFIGARDERISFSPECVLLLAGTAHEASGD